MTHPEAAPPEPGQYPHHRWSRLHPLSPLVRLGRAVVPVVVLIGSNAFASGHDRRGPASGWVFVILLTLPIVLGFISWAVTRWRIDGGDLQIESGLARRQSLRIPLNRIQAVDVVSPLLARFFGLAEVNVVVAGSGSERGHLAFVTTANAAVIRAQLLALAHGLRPETPEPQAWPVIQVGNGRLLAGLVLTAPMMVSLGFMLGAVGVVALAPGDAAAASSAIPIVLGTGTAVARRLNNEFNFVIAEAPDGLRLHSGLLQTRGETIPYGRIQAVRWVSPLLWKPLGWSRLEVDVARQQVRRGSHDGNRQLTRTLLPVGTRSEAAWLLSRVMPGATLEVPTTSRAPRRAALRAPLSYRYLASWFDNRYVAARTGMVRPAIVIAPLAKAQSVRLRSGPWQRALRLASVHVDTAGRRWQAAAYCRDAGMAGEMVDALSAYAHRARNSVPGSEF